MTRKTGFYEPVLNGDAIDKNQSNFPEMIRNNFLSSTLGQAEDLELKGMQNVAPNTQTLFWCGKCLCWLFLSLHWEQIHIVFITVLAFSKFA